MSRAGSYEDCVWLPHLPLPLRGRVFLGAGLNWPPGKAWWLTVTNAIIYQLTTSEVPSDWTGLQKTLWKYKLFPHYLEFHTEIFFSPHPLPLAVFLSPRHLFQNEGGRTNPKLKHQVLMPPSSPSLCPHRHSIENHTEKRTSFSLFLGLALVSSVLVLFVLITPFSEARW